MKCFRVVDLQYSSPSQILDGNGAKNNAGRWNVKGRRLVNSSTTEITALAEKGFYSLILKIRQYKADRTNFFKEQIENVRLKLATIEVQDYIQPIDLTDPIQLNLYLNSAKLPQRNPSESRLSAFNDLPGKWTQALSEHLFANKKIGFQAISARSNAGNNLLWFSELFSEKDINVKKIEDVRLLPCDSSGVFTMQRQKIVEDKVVAVLNDRTHIVDVLNFPI